MSCRVSFDTSICAAFDVMVLMILATEEALAFLIRKTRVISGAIVWSELGMSPETIVGI